MLGKLIKNEFINRGKQAASIFIAFLCLGVIVAVMGAINEYTYIESNFFHFSYMFFIVLFSISHTVVVAALVLGSVNDFGNRFFKDQGYLTHTLPVKTSTLMLARMVYDLALIATLAIVVPFVLCIATRDFSLYSSIADGIRSMLDTRYSGVFEYSIVIIDVILICVTFLILALAAMWTFNVSYAIGHAFNNAKKLITALVFWLICVINWSVTFIVGEIILDADVFSVQGHAEVTLMLDLIVVIAVASVSVAIYAVITGYIFKKKLNLE